MAEGLEAAGFLGRASVEEHVADPAWLARGPYVNPETGRRKTDSMPT